MFRGALADGFLQRLLRLGFLFGDGVVFRLRVVGKGLDIGDHGVCRFDLRIQLGLLGVQFLLEELLLVTGLLVALLDGLNILARRHVLLFQSFVVVHDVVDIADARKKLGHAGGIKDKARVGIGAVLLHGADAGTEKLGLRRFLFESLVKLRLLFGDDLIVDLDLFTDQLDHLAVDLDFVIERELAGDEAGLLAGEIVDDVLLFLRLLLKSVKLFLEIVDLRLGNGIRRQRCGKSRRGEKSAENRTKGFLDVFHSKYKSPGRIKPSDSCGSPWLRRTRRRECRWQETRSAAASSAERTA